MRPLTSREKDLLRRMADKLRDQERKQLLADLERAVADPLTSDGSRIRFEIAGYQRPPRQGQHLLGVEGKTHDRDGTELTVLLHADENGRLLELEVIRWGQGDLTDPDWNALSLY
jgi:hypothetical protein